MLCFYRELIQPGAADPYFANVSLLLRGENGPSIIDESNNALAITASGDAGLSSVVKKYGNSSIKFDGSGDYITLPYSANLNLTGDFTIETWINPSNSDDFTLIGSVNGPAASGYLNIVKGFGSNIAIGRINVTWDLFFPISFATNIWQHLAITRSGSDVRLFLDGIQMGSTQNNTTSWMINPAGMRIAASHDALFLFTGYLDDFRITQGVARYTANFTPPTEELPAS